MDIGDLEKLLRKWPGKESEITAKLPAGDGTFYRYEILDVEWDDETGSVVIVVDSRDEGA